MIPTQKELKLQEFAENILSILETTKEWSSDTTDEIAALAIDMGLAETSRDGEFVAKEEFNSWQLAPKILTYRRHD